MTRSGCSACRDTGITLDAHDGASPRQHHCHLRQARPHLIAWIASDDHEPVPLGWETYPGLLCMPDF